MLARFAPIGVREPQLATADFEDDASSPRSRGLVTLGVASGLAAGVLASLAVALMSPLDNMRANPGSALAFGRAWSAIWRPGSMGDWQQVASVMAFACAGGLVVVAASARRHRTGRAP